MISQEKLSKFAIVLKQISLEIKMLPKSITMGDFGTYWRMTINNYDERDLALVRQGYPDDIRKLIWTLEEGQNGTPHIQAYIQMKRSVRLSHMKKLFPGANFGQSNNAEWRLNQHNYPQKNDETTRSAHVIQNNDPLHTVEGTLRRVINDMIEQYADDVDLQTSRRYVERAMVIEDYTMAKVFVSSTYKAMWKEFGHEMYENLWAVRQERLKEADTHAHTHAEKKFSHAEGITNAADDQEGGKDSQDSSGGEEDAEGEDFEDGCGETDEGYSEGSGDCSDAEDDWERAGEQGDRQSLFGWRGP